MTYLYDEKDPWTFDILQNVMEEIEIIAKEELGLTYHPVQIEIVDSTEMLNLYSSHAMPLMYNHWSFGKDFLMNQKMYQRGMTGLAFEIIQNTNPSIAYCMDTNSMTMQALVLSHASVGHNSFFTNNYLFKDWTDAKAMLDYMSFAKNYISECEEKYGYEKVEEILDCCHSLQFSSMDKYSRAPQLSVEEEKEHQKKRQAMIQEELNTLWATLPTNFAGSKKPVAQKKFPEEQEENLLYFVEKYSPILEPWEREIVRIIRKIAQFWWPNLQTKMINEGWACFTHYYIMNRLWEKGKITDGSYLEFIKSHTSVTYQPDYNDVRVFQNGQVVSIYGGINPYALGFDMFMDIKRMCENPTDEDREFFPDVAGGNWVEQVKLAYENYRDELFILQYLSPHLIRKWRFFHLQDHGEDYEFYNVEKIHNERGYSDIRHALAKLNDFNEKYPNIVIDSVDMKGDRKVKMIHYAKNEIPLSKKSNQALKNFVTLWGFDATIESIDTATGDSLGKIQVVNRPDTTTNAALSKSKNP